MNREQVRPSNGLGFKDPGKQAITAYKTAANSKDF